MCSSEVSEVLKLLLSYITFYSRYGQLIFLSYKWSVTCTVYNHRKKCHIHLTFCMVSIFVKNTEFWQVAQLLLLGEIQEL